jgi:hypothetical protein
MTNAVTIQTANQLLNRQIMDRLKAIGSGKYAAAQEASAETPAEAKSELEPVSGEQPTPAETPAKKKSAAKPSTRKKKAPVEQQVPPEKTETE